MSSSAHLVLVPEFFNMPAPTVAFDVLVHLATLVAVVGYFIQDVAKMVTSLVRPKRMNRAEVKYWRRMVLWLVIGSIPAAFAGLLLGDFFEGLFSSTLAVGVFLVVTSLLLWGADFAYGTGQPAAGRDGQDPGHRRPGHRLLPGPGHRSRSQPFRRDHVGRRLPRF